eukprot:scaffold2145_cov136-Skeletonema_menzelii.AAC.2
MGCSIDYSQPSAIWETILRYLRSILKFSSPRHFNSILHMYGLNEAAHTIPITGCRSLYRGFSETKIPERVTETRSMHRGFATTDDAIDSRATLLLEEIHRVRHNYDGHDLIESNMLQSVEQTFEVDDYLRALESEVDRLLRSQAMTKRYRNPANHLESQIETHCRACDSNPCKWSPYCDAEVLARRRKQLFGGIKSANDRTKQQISEEILSISAKINLASVDKELHEAYAAKDDETIAVRSIHGFPATLNRADAIAALEHEHNRHVGSIVAKNVVDDILRWMLDGWYFGQYSQPSTSTSLSDPPPLFVKRGSLIEKANDVQMHSNSAAPNSMALQEEKRANLASMQTTTKYALFSITFSYFRALHLVRQQKEVFAMSCSKPQLSNERMKMIQEHKNFIERQQRIQYFMRMAKKGEEMKLQRIEQKRMEERRISQFENMKKLAMNRLAAVIQRVYRGYLARKTVENLRHEQQKADLAVVFFNGCATEIMRVWRGYCGRRDTERLRREMAEFLFILREREAGVEEEEFAMQLQSLDQA